MTEPPNSDISWSLIARAASGDRGAQSVFSRGYLPVVQSFLEARWRATPLAGELDDAVQEVFIECLRHNGVLSKADPDRGDVRGLLFGVTKKVAQRFEERLGKRIARTPGTDSILDTIQTREPSLSMVFDRGWAKTLLRLAGEQMREASNNGSPGARLRVELLRLRFTEGMPVREIAAKWEMDPDAVHRAYAKARDEFRTCLRRIVGEHVVRSEVDLDDEVTRILQLLD